MGISEQIDQADHKLVNAVLEWSIDNDRTRADRELREAVFVYRQAMDEVNGAVRSLVR